MRDESVEIVHILLSSVDKQKQTFGIYNRALIVDLLLNAHNSNIYNVADDFLIRLDSIQVGVCFQELIVVVQQHGRVDNWREANGWHILLQTRIK